MNYPTLLKRVQSAFVDQILAFSLIGIFITISNKIDETSVSLKVLAIIAGLSYEPVTMALSGTVGQLFTGIKVQWNTEIPFRILISYQRFIIKMLLGWISFITIHFNPQRRAIHDYISGSIVIYK